ncbi:MAG: efflux RND transporter periplasmic adaptor subunit [Planctomycetota bacterium]
MPSSNAPIQVESESSKLPDPRDILDPKIIAELIEVHDAKSVTCWCLHDDGTLIPHHATGRLGRSEHERSRELVRKAIRSQSQESFYWSSPEGLWVVAQPDEDEPAECITVAFACDVFQLADASNEDRLDAVGRLSRSMRRIRTERSTHPPCPSSESENVETSCSPSVKTPAVGVEFAGTQNDSLPSWSLLFRQVIRKCIADIGEIRTKAHFHGMTLLGILVIGCLPCPYTISCKTVCEPCVRRYVAAPFDARLSQVRVLTGQPVRQGQVLVTLDGSDLRSQLAGLRAEAAQAEQRLMAALANGDHSKAEFERLENEHLGREIDMLTRRQKELEIRAPIDGIIVTGDLERSEGVRLSTGDPLFEIGSLDHLIAEIAIPEDQVNHVDEMMPVDVQLEAAPNQDGASSISKIYLRSEIRDNENVFIAEAKLENSQGLLRPGMNGVARIRSGNRPLAWIWLHRPVRAVRRWLGW